MKMRDWLVGIVATALTAAYLLLMPGYLATQRQELTLQSRQESGESFSGIITLWHIVGFKPYQGSLGTWLSDRAAALEKKHFGVFINVTAMTPEEFEERLLRGERADAYSFPMGWGYVERFQPLPDIKAELLPALDGTGTQEGEIFAVPYTISGYLLLANSRLEQEKNISLSEETWREDLQTAVDTLTYTYGKRNRQRYGMAGSELQAAMMGLECKVPGYDLFKSGDAALAIGDIRDAGDLDRLQAAGKGFTYRAWPAGSYTDLVQYLAVARDTDKAKLPYIASYFELILREDHQASLIDLGLLPVVRLTEEKVVQIDIVAAVQAALAQPEIPNAFLYQRYHDELLALARRALSGDAPAAKDLATRMKELVTPGQIQ